MGAPRPAAEASLRALRPAACGPLSVRGSSSGVRGSATAAALPLLPAPEGGIFH